MIGLIKGTARQAKTVSGLPLPIASYKSNSKLPIQELSLSINPTQSGSGDPYPAGGGKNKFNCSANYNLPINNNGVTVTLGDDGLLHFSGTCSTNFSIYGINQSYYGVVGTPIKFTVFGASETLVCVPFKNNNSTTAITTDGGTSTTLANAESDVFYLRIDLKAGTNYTGKTLGIVFSLASETITSFIPYSNIRPITGVSSVNVSRTGKNLLPMPITSGSYPNQVTITVNNDKSFYISKPSGSGWTTIPLATMMLKKGTYTLIEDDDSSDNCAINVYLAGTTTSLLNTRYAKRYVFTVTEDTKVDINYSRSAAANNVLTKLMLFVGNTATATDYEPYNGNTYTIALGDTYYGATLDVVRGKLVVDRGYATIDNTGWYSFSVGTGNASAVKLIDCLPLFNSGASNYNGSIMNIGKEFPNYWTSGRPNEVCPDMAYAYYLDGNNKMNLRIHRSDVASNQDITAFQNNLPNDIQLVYYLATPIEIDLGNLSIPSLLGQNHIWHDGNGDVEVLKFMDRQLYFGR